MLKNVRTSRRLELEALPEFQKACRQMEKKLGADGRILVRLSGTEPLVRVMIEGANHDQIDQMADELCALLRKADVQ